jgi:hypothetical protein
MPNYSPAELREMLVATTFQSAAFTVAKGEKTQDMLEREAEHAAQLAAARTAPGLPATPRVYPNPNPAPPAVLEKLAGVLKYFIRDDAALEAETRIKFKDHFTGVLTQGQLILEPLCDGIFDAAVPADVEYLELKKRGLHKGGVAYGLDTLARWVRSTTYGECMPNGDLDDDYACALALMRMDQTLIGGELAWNEMDCAITINREPITMSFLSSKIREAFGATYSIASRGRRGMRRLVPCDAYVQAAVEHIARENTYHPTREWLKALPTWDGQDYFAMLLQAIGGVQDTAELFHESLQRVQDSNALALSQLRKTFIGSVARTFEPGCQMDTVLVLKAKQGTRKSSLFRALAPADRFSSSHFEFGSKDARLLFQKVSWIEIAELSAMTRKDVQLVKSEITTRSDDYRQPYAKDTLTHPRQCIMIGSTNDEAFLKDPTGSRRFWVIQVDDSKKTDIAYITKIKNQLWAQAVHLYVASATCAKCQEAADGEVRCPEHRWWLGAEEDTLREDLNQQYTEQEPYVAALQGWLRNAITDKKTTKQGIHPARLNTDELTTAELLDAVIGLPPDKCHDAGHQKRMAYALKECGFIKKHTKHYNVWISPGMQNRPSLSIVPPITTDEEIEKKSSEDAGTPTLKTIK